MTSRLPCVMDKTLDSCMFPKGPWKYVLHLVFVSHISPTLVMINLCHTSNENYCHCLFF